MKQRLFSILLCLCLVLMLFPATAFAEEPTVSYSLTIEFEHGTYRDQSNSYCFGTDYLQGDPYDLSDLLAELTGYEPYVLVDWQGPVKGIFENQDITVKAVFSEPSDTNITINDQDEVSAQQDYESTYYNVTYNPGEYGTGSIASGTKTLGEEFTLSSETFTREGYVQTAWTEENGTIYELGGVYSTDADVTLYPVWNESSYSTDADVTLNPLWNGNDDTTTLNVPFTTTVTLGDKGVPSETTFALAIVDVNAGPEAYKDVTVFGTVTTTNGAGSYTGNMTFTGPFNQLWRMLSEGAIVQQVDAGEKGWVYDHTAFGLVLQDVASRSGDAVQYTMFIFPTSRDDTTGCYSIDYNAGSLELMSFENTYTAHDYTQKFNETHHWNECGCGDIQNKEEHKYGEWKVTKEATETDKGEKEHTCTICGYSETETIPMLEHTHDYTQKFNKTHHWDECGCGDIQNKEAHKYGEWKVTKEATETDKGEKEHTCTVCGYSETAEIAKLPAIDTTKPTESNLNAGETTSPQTGDNSNLILWSALLFVGGFGMISTGMYSKRRKTSRTK